VATKLVVEREELIKAFDAKEYWTIQARLKGAEKAKEAKEGFEIKLHKVGVGSVGEEENSSDEETDEGEQLKLGNGRFDKATVDQVFGQLAVTPSPVGRGLG
jgi:DNA topoisomerase IA